VRGLGQGGHLLVGYLDLGWGSRGSLNRNNSLLLRSSLLLRLSSLLRSSSAPAWSPPASRVADVLTAGAALGARGAPDPSVVRALTGASRPAFGVIGPTTIAPFLAATGYAARTARLLPGWATWSAYLLAPLNLARVAALLRGSEFLETMVAGGSSVAGRYSYPQSAAGVAYLGWLLAASIALRRRGPATADIRPAADAPKAGDPAAAGHARS